MIRFSKLLIAPLLFGVLVNCSAIIDTNTKQCSVDTECAKYNANGQTYSCVSGGCVVAAATPAAKECTVNADCAAKGDNFICRKSDNKCASIVSAECTHVVGDYKNDSAIIIGSILPTAGPDQTSGLPIQDAIDVALADFQSVNNLPAVPGSTARRPLVLIGCNDNSDDTAAVAAAKHLSENVKVPAIIGSAFSGITIKISTEVTIPAGVFLISPSATSVAITSISDNGLLWRTSPSDLIQADAHAALYPLIETKVLGGASRSVKVAIANKGDAYGQGLSGALQSKLVINGKPFLDAGNNDFRLVSDYGDPDGQTPPDYANTIAKIIALKPDIAYLLGTTEVVTELLKGIETGWPAATPRPTYLVADGALVSEMWDTVNAVTDPTAREDLRHRILGSVPGTLNANFQKFKVLYDSRIKDGTVATTGGAANAYDAFYNIAYAVVAAGTKPITGASIAEGMGQLVATGVPVLEVGAANINTAFTTLAAGQKIDFNGASGPLDYDLQTGEASSDIQVWCMPLSGGNAGVGTTTTAFYNAQTKALAGTIDTIKTDCNF